MCGIIWGHTNSDGSLEQRFNHFLASYENNKLSWYSRRASHAMFGIIWGQQSQKVVQKSVSYNLWHHMGTTNSEGKLKKYLTQCVASYEDDKLRMKSRRAPHTIYGVIWGQQTQNVLQTCGSYKLWRHMETTNLEGCLEERAIQFVASQDDNKHRRQSRRASNTNCGIIWGAQTQKIVQKSVIYNFLHYMVSTNQ